MTTERLPVVVALAALVMAAGVSCCKPQTLPVVAPCPPISIPAKPILPIGDYKPEWTKDQLLKAYTESTLLLLGWQKAAIVVMQAHNAPKSK